MDQKSTANYFKKASALFRKDLIQHRSAFLGLFVFLVFTWFLFAITSWSAPSRISLLETHALFMRMSWVITAFAVGNRLVVSENYGRTFRFLETLPLGRFAIGLTKYITGFFLLISLALGSALLSFLFAALFEAIEESLIVAILIRTLGFCASVWSFVFMMGHLGKLRIVLYVVFSFALLILSATTEFELLRWGPFALVGKGFVFDPRVPWRELGVSVGLAFACFGIAAWLESFRDGSLQERLAQPLSARERAMTGIAIIALLMAGTGLAPEPEPDPYHLSGPHVVFSRRVPLGIAYGSQELEDAAKSLLNELEASLLELQEAMGWSALPSLRISHRSSLDNRTFEIAHLRRGDGALVRANLSHFAGKAQEADPQGLEAALIRALFEDRRNRRAAFEPQAWFFWGFPVWWASCGPSKFANHSEGPCRLPLQRRLAAQLPIIQGRAVGAKEFLAWNTVLEQYGEHTAEALAGTAIQVLAEKKGSEVPILLAKRWLAPWAPNDSRISFVNWLFPPPKQIEKQVGISID
ncbi:MAG: ABC-2 transporter permease [Deltaproteobacteria bacterium]|nr:ABC-2 transporter permease [Deltaproteobacteria bacterium]